MVICLSVQCIVVSLLLRYFIKLEKKNAIRPTLLNASSILIISMLVMLIGTFVQITIWAWLFWVYGEFETFETAFYHSVVNFSSLGYGDIVMSEEKRLLGALESTNGVLMLGLTTAFLYSVLNAIVSRAWFAEFDSGGDAE